MFALTIIPPRMQPIGVLADDNEAIDKQKEYDY